MGNGRKSDRLRVIYGDATLGVYGKSVSCIFSRQMGGLESLVADGREWLYRMPRPAFWRALTDNDRGSGFHLRSGMWLAADMFITCREIQVSIDGRTIPLPKAPYNNCYTSHEEAEKVSVLFIYETITVPAARVYLGKKGLPQLPVFGMRFIMPTKAVRYEYEGLSGETYPDRMAGAIPGVYRIDGLPVTKYLVPQDCNVHMGTKWLKVYRDKVLDLSCKKKEAFSLCFAADEEPFAFSCIPYTPEELENATHQEELPPARRTVVSILGAVRGVGGIDSWGTDVEERYHISGEKDIFCSFSIHAGGENS